MVLVIKLCWKNANNGNANDGVMNLGLSFVKKVIIDKIQVNRVIFFKKSIYVPPESGAIFR
jgi:hypothetical protein